MTTFFLGKDKQSSDRDYSESLIREIPRTGTANGKTHCIQKIQLWGSRHAVATSYLAPVTHVGIGDDSLDLVII